MRRVRRVRRDARGLAEIVGTLLLVLIVVAAAVAFSLFVASYQSQLQAEETAAHNRALQDIRVLSLSSNLNTTNDGLNYTNLSFVAGSLDVNTMTVNELAINGQIINFYSVTPLGGPTALQVCEVCNPAQPAFKNTMEEFNLTSLEQVTVHVNLTTWNPTYQIHGAFFNFYNLSSSGPTDFVSISIYTTLGNDFNRVFDAPTAVALTELSQIFSNNSYQSVVEFDGSQSIVPANDTIVSWSWSIRDLTNASFALPGGNELSGEKVLVSQSEFQRGNYTAMLIVTDSEGLAGSATIPYVAA